jgi:putative peptidoglycan lipid II flippase
VENLQTENNMPSKAVQTAAKTAILMAVLLLCSKCIGFVREMVMAAFFGTSYITDAYVMAQSIPNMLFAGIFGAVATGYIPLLSDYMEKGSQEEGNAFTSRVINILLVISALSALVGLFFSDKLTALMAPGFEEETAILTSRYLKITFMYTVFSATAGILEAYLQYKGTFIPQVIIGYSQSAILIVTIIVSAYTDCYFLAFGLLIAYIVRLILMYVMARKKGYRYSLHRGSYGKVFKQIIPLAIPVFIGHCGYQINMFVDKYLASGLIEGSVSALNYGNLLNGMIMTLSTSVLNTIIYPKIAQASASDRRDSVIAMSQTGVNLSVLIALPFAMGAIVYSGEIVQIVFERGAFDVAATELTTGAYRFYSVGMTFMALNTFLTSVAYSIKDTRRPMYFALASVVVNIVVNLMLVGSMQHCGLALATSCAAAVNSVLLYVGLRHFHGINVVPSWSKMVKIALASAVSVGVSYLCYRGLVAAVWMPRMVYLGLAVIIAVGIYPSLLKIFKIEELKILTSVLRRRTR